MKGIIITAGKGTRLYPMTASISKPLLPVYNKPMIYYPLATLMEAGIQDILIVVSPDAQASYETLLGDGGQWGIRISYAVQSVKNGTAGAFLVGKEFVNGDSCCMIMGDNLFFGHGLSESLRAALGNGAGATVFAYPVRDPERYGVVSFDANGKVVSLEEKPKNPTSPYAVPGLYVYDANAMAYAEHLTPSPRGELEITDVNRLYLENGMLHVQVLARGIAWLDTGTPQSLLHAANFVETVEERQGIMVGSPDEIAYRMGYINREQLIVRAESIRTSTYGESLAYVTGLRSLL